MNKERRQMNPPAPSPRRLSRLGALAASIALAAGVLGATATAGAVVSDNFDFESTAASLSTDQAGAHPDYFTSFTVNGNPAQSDFYGQKRPWARARDVTVELPPGLLGNPAAFPSCPMSVFSNVQAAFSDPSLPLCPLDTQIGLTSPGLSSFFPAGLLNEPLYNLEPPGGDVVARLGFIAVFTPVFLDVRLDPERDNALTVTVTDISALVSLTQADTTIWGVPTDSSHDTQRYTPIEALLCVGQCPGVGPIASGLEPTAFMSNPTSCGPAETGYRLTSYSQPERFAAAFSPLSEIVDCASVPFEPSLSLKPTTRRAGTASGVDFELEIPQEGLTEPNGEASAHLKKAVITLPEGVSLNASAADGLGSCTQEQIGVDRDELQLVAGDANGAPLRLSFDGQSTPELPDRAGAAAAQAALEALPNLGPGDVALEGGFAPWEVRFSGSRSGQDVPQVTATYSEVQQLAVRADGGTFTLSFDGETTAAIPLNASAAAVQAALEALPGIAPGEIEVGGAQFVSVPGGSFANSMRIVFSGSLAQSDVPAISVDGSSLSGFETIASVNVLNEGGSSAVVRTIKQGGALGFDGEEATCPDSSKVGFGEIVTPVLNDPLNASLYVADQDDNPFDSLLAGYMVAKGKGVRLKVAGKFDLDPASGRIKATFDNNPQQPFSSLELHFKGGNRGVITTPSECGVYGVDYELVPWSGNPPVSGTSQFALDENCGAHNFAPGFRAGSANPWPAPTAPSTCR
jgi:hypothetical protein